MVLRGYDEPKLVELIAWKSEFREGSRGATLGDLGEDSAVGLGGCGELRVWG